MAKQITYYPAKQNTYFGTTVKVVGIAGVAYLLWYLFHHLPFSGPGHWGWNPFGGGGNSDKGNKPKEGDNPNGGGGGDYNNNGSGGSGNNTDDADDIIVTRTDTYYKDADGKYYNAAGVLYTGSINGVPLSNVDFIKTYYSPALKAQKITGVFPETMFAQAILESSSGGKVGGSELGQKANNLFGIEADSSWTGNTYQGYRAYDSFQDSIVDYYNFLQNNSRYDTALQATTPADQINEIAAAGYAQDSNYGDKLNSLLPLVMAAESTVPNPDSSYTPTATDAAVNTDKQVERASTWGNGATGMDNFTAWIIEHKTAIKWVAGIGLVIVVTGAATNGFKKNPLKRLVSK